MSDVNPLRVAQAVAAPVSSIAPVVAVAAAVAYAPVVAVAAAQPATCRCHSAG